MKRPVLFLLGINLSVSAATLPGCIRPPDLLSQPASGLPFPVHCSLLTLL
jgi:hypothetical protein